MPQDPDTIAEFASTNFATRAFVNAGLAEKEDIDDANTAHAAALALIAALDVRVAALEATTPTLVAPAFRAVTSGTQANSASFAIVLPTFEAGDLCVLPVCVETDEGQWLFPPAGQPWEQIDYLEESQARMKLYGRIMKAGDTAPTLKNELSTADTAWACASYSGVDPNRPWEARNFAKPAGGTTHAINDTTTLGEARTIISVIGHNPTAGSSTATPPAAMTERADVVLSTDVQLALADQVDVAEGDHDYTWTSSESDTHGLFCLALVPEGGGEEVLIHEDDCASATESTVLDIWGANAPAYTNISRITRSAAGGPADGPYREFTIQNGDDPDGGGTSERVEVGYNENRFGDRGRLAKATNDGTFAIYQEGQRRVTTMWIYVPTAFDIATAAWKLVMQMKESNPNDGTGVGSPILTLELHSGGFILASSIVNFIEGVGCTKNVWVKHEFDVVYSGDPTAGKLRWKMDDITVFEDSACQTLQNSNATGTYFTNGQPIPSHLRQGIYRNSSYTNTESIRYGKTRVVAPAGSW